MHPTWTFKDFSLKILRIWGLKKGEGICSEKFIFKNLPVSDRQLFFFHQLIKTERKKTGEIIKILFVTLCNELAWVE